MINKDNNKYMVLNINCVKYNLVQFKSGKYDNINLKKCFNVFFTE